jgi:hypothetical protein
VGSEKIQSVHLAEALQYRSKLMIDKGSGKHSLFHLLDHVDYQQLSNNRIRESSEGHCDTRQKLIHCNG